MRTPREIIKAYYGNADIREIDISADGEVIKDIMKMYAEEVLNEMILEMGDKDMLDMIKTMRSRIHPSPTFKSNN